MFKIVEHTIGEQLILDLLEGIVDIQLVGDDLACDKHFILDKSILRDPVNQTYTYLSLCDKITPDELSDIRKFIGELLTELVGESILICFISGGVEDLCELEELESWYTINVDSHKLGLSGRVDIVEMDIEDILCRLELFGHYDSVRGLAVSPSDVPKVFDALCLASPVPTTDTRFLFQPIRKNALDTAFKYGKFLFEELNNGTRFRMASNIIETPEFVNKVEKVISRCAANTKRS